MTTMLRAGMEQSVTTRLVLVTCYKCGIIFGLPEYFNRKRHEDKESWYCPNGHGQVYAKSSVQIEKERADKIEQERKFWVDYQRDAAAQLEREHRMHAATKGQLTKTRKRAIAGTCPCCSRSFVDVRRHMASKHPDEAVRGFGNGSALLGDKPGAPKTKESTE